MLARISAGSVGAGVPLLVSGCTFVMATPAGSTSMEETSGRKFCCRYGNVTASSDGEIPLAPAVKTAFHCANRAGGLVTPPAGETGAQSDHVLSGTPVLPVRVRN